jgi:hypothetical protein
MRAMSRRRARARVTCRASSADWGRLTRLANQATGSALQQKKLVKTIDYKEI